jgi:hypothetical protein
LKNGSEDLKETINEGLPNHQFLQKYWLAKVNNEYIGICSLYAYKSAPKDAWLGAGLGSLKMQEEKVMQLKF